MKIDTITMIEDFHQLISCPQLKKILYHKIEEIKYKDAVVIEKISQLKARLKLDAGGKTIGAAGQPFYLLKVNNRWYPSIPGETNRIAYDLIPRELINVIIDDPGAGEGILNKTVEIEGVIKCVVSYGKFEDYYKGWIKDICRTEAERPKIVDRDNSDLKERLKIIETMLDYLLNDRRYFEHASNDFKFWKTLIDQKNKAI